MAERLICIPSSVTLRCGSDATVRIRTSDNKKGVGITALGFDDTVATVNPETGGTTAGDGSLDVNIRCSGVGDGCPGATTVTFDASGYTPCSVNIRCEAPSRREVAQIAFAVVPLQVLPQLLSAQLSTVVGSSTVFPAGLAEEEAGSDKPCK